MITSIQLVTLSLVVSLPAMIMRLPMPILCGATVWIFLVHLWLQDGRQLRRCSTTSALFGHGHMSPAYVGEEHGRQSTMINHAEPWTSAAVLI